MSHDYHTGKDGGLSRRMVRLGLSEKLTDDLLSVAIRAAEVTDKSAETFHRVLDSVITVMEEARTKPHGQ